MHIRQTVSLIMIILLLSGCKKTQQKQETSEMENSSIMQEEQEVLPSDDSGPSYSGYDWLTYEYGKYEESPASKNNTPAKEADAFDISQDHAH